jgi:WD40 repeat protein
MVWDFRSGQVLYFNTGSPDAVTCLAVAPNGFTAATGSSNRTIRVWNLHTLTEIGMIGQHDGGVIGIAYSANGRRILSASDVGELRAWDLKTGQNLMGRRNNMAWKCAAFSPDGKLLLAGALDGAVHLYDVENQGNLIRQVKAHQSLISGVAFSPDGSRFATAVGVEVALWETATGKKISVLRLPQQNVNGTVAILPTNRHILFGGNGVSLVLMSDGSGDATSRPTDAK